MENIKLTLKEKLSYGVGSLGASTIYGLTSTYLILFYTDYFHIPVGVIAALFLFARILDAVTDLGMGIIVDNTKSRWGKFRPYLLISPWFIAITTVLCFSAPNFSEQGKVVWVFATYILWGLSFTSRDIPYWSMSAALTQDTQERNSVVMIPRSLAMIGIISINVITLPLVKLLGNGNDMRGWQGVALLYGILVIVFSLITFFNVRERTTYKREKTKLSDVINALKNNSPLRNLLLHMGISEIIFTIKNIFPIYYLTYNYKKPEMIPVFMGVYAVSTVVGVFLSPVLAKKIGKKGVGMLGSFCAAMVAVAMFFTGYKNINILFFWVVLSGIFEGLTEVARTSMLADTVEYGEWKTGKRSEGIVFSSNIFKTKVASAIGGAVGAYALGVIGYIPNAVQSEFTLNGIHLAFTIVPGILALIALIPLYKYDLTEEKYNQILFENNTREQETGVTP